MSTEAAVHSKQFGQARNTVVERIKQKGNENLADILETTVASKIAKEDFINGLKISFPESEAELIALHEKAKEYQSKGIESYNPYDYFEDMPNGTQKFQPVWLAEAIEDEYNFIWVQGLDTLYIYKDGYWKPQGQRIIEEECNKRLDHEFRQNRCREVIEAIRTRQSIPRHQFSPTERKLNFKNGTYNLETGELEEHKPEDYFTQKIPWEYDSDAQCFAIHEFVDDITGSEEDKETLIEASGYCLLPSFPISQSFILIGEGSNGKTMFLELLKEILGRENYKEEELQQLENTRFGTQALYQKLALFSDDLPSTKLQTGTTFKALTGGGDVRAEIKGGEHFQFKNYATPMFACNQIPETQDESDGFFRRWKIINFPYKFRTDPDPENDYEKEAKPENQLKKEILDEDEVKGFINEAVAHLELLLDQGRFTHDYDPEVTRKLWHSYSAPLEEFIEKYVEQGITKAEAERRSRNQVDWNRHDYDYIVKDHLLELASIFCRERGSRAPSKGDITNKLKKMNYNFRNTRSQLPFENTNQTTIWRGITFSDKLFEELIGLQGLQGFRNISRVRVKENFIQELRSEYATPASESDVNLSDVRDILPESDGLKTEKVAEELEISEDQALEMLQTLSRDGEAMDIDPDTWIKI